MSYENNVTIFYYTGTGNSLWIARALARELGSARLVSIVSWEEQPTPIDSPVIGLVFPVHIWVVPRRIMNFLDHLQAMSPEHIFAIANNGGQVSNTLLQLQKAMLSKGLTLSSGWSVVLPSNYIPWGGPGSLQEQNQRFDAARLKISDIADEINNRAVKPVERGPLWQRILFTWIYNLSFSHVPEMDKSFWVDERCNKCGLCVKVCPTHNIVMQDDKLTWQNKCEQCLACIQWCPEEALQYGKKTPAYPRYHHPEIKYKDLIRKNGE
ncbi:MAG: 4Fe-4S binding protein [Clostridiaceae bacterium]|nr:4Fe-4S binding protein [Clostridiaceae bacterium]